MRGCELSGRTVLAGTRLLGSPSCGYLQALCGSRMCFPPRLCPLVLPRTAPALRVCASARTGISGIWHPAQASERWKSLRQRTTLEANFLTLNLAGCMKAGASVLVPG